MYLCGLYLVSVTILKRFPTITWCHVETMGLQTTSLCVTRPTPRGLEATWFIAFMIRCRTSSFHSPLVVGVRREARAFVGVQASLDWWSLRRKASKTIRLGCLGIYVQWKMRWRWRWWWRGCRPTVLGKVGDHIKVMCCVHGCKRLGPPRTILVYHTFKF